MNGLDVILLIVVAVAVAGGWRLGLVTRALGWVGALVSIMLGMLVVPAVNRWVSPSSDGAVLLLTAGTFILLISLGQALGVAAGARIRPAPTEGRIRRFDAIGGSILGVVGIVGLVWILAPLMASTTGWVASATRTSTLTRAVTEHLPPPPDSLKNLENSLVNGDFPQLFADMAPTPELPQPPDGSPIGAEELQRLAASSAKIQGEACSVVQSGSGFAVGEGLWVTNAHVVAGTDEVTLTTAQGATGTGTTVAFDPRYDLALVRSEDVTGPPLRFDTQSSESTGLVLGFPGGGPFEPSPFLVGDDISATGYDIYDGALVRRDLLVLAAALEPGDSGSAVVDGDGEVIGMAVAVAPDRPGVAYALDAAGVREHIATAGPGAEAVSTGRCLG